MYGVRIILIHVIKSGALFKKSYVDRQGLFMNGKSEAAKRRTHLREAG